MQIYCGNSLEELVTNGLKEIHRERFLLKELDSYINSTNDFKVCCLYGLRRTGKTIMSLQEMGKINDYPNCLYVRCENGDTIWGVREAIDKVLKGNPACNYIFVDEITKAERFVTACSFFADDYATKNKKVVLAGTHSLGFHLAKKDELLNRVHSIHTTYIPFKEFNYILGRDIHDYIRYGGTLTDGEENVFYNNDTEAIYTNSTIVENISHTLKSWKDGNNSGYIALKGIIESDDFNSYVRKILELHNRTFFEDTINESFKSNSVGSVAELMTQHKFGSAKEIAAVVSEKMNERIRFFLGIKEQHFTLADKRLTEMLIKYLKDLDVLYEIPANAYLEGRPLRTASGSHTPEPYAEYIFTQAGMRYCQVNEILDAFMTSDVFQGFSVYTKESISEKLRTDVCGKILEDIVFYQLSKENEQRGGEKITKRRIIKHRSSNNADAEIDVIVLDFEEEAMLAIEVKHSDGMVQGQTKHLSNEALCDEIADLTGLLFANKAVIYNGENSETQDGILYLNASNFLCNSQKMLNVLLREPIKSYKELSELLKAEECVPTKNTRCTADLPNITGTVKKDITDD